MTVTRARDPGKRLFQYQTQWGVVNWVVCPRCGGPAKRLGRRLTCIRCGYARGVDEDKPRRGQRVDLVKRRPSCARCKGEIPRRGRAVGMGENGAAIAQVRCPACGHRGEYPAYTGTSPRHAPIGGLPYFMAPYLWRDLGGGHSIFALNLEHLDALETWLGATLRERGDTAGLTMMARLPRWMKSAAMRPRVVKALADMREEAARVGIT